MTSRVIYNCDGCRKVIESGDVLRYNEPRDNVAYVPELFTVNRRFLVATGVHERTRYEWHFCSKDCVALFAAGDDRE